MNNLCDLYNSNVIVTYPFYDPELRVFKTDTYDISDVIGFEELTEIIYQSELLKVFNLNLEQDINISYQKIIKILAHIQKLNVDLKNNSINEFIHCIETIQEKYNCALLEDAFVFMFSYTYFFLTHKCISNILETNIINDENIKHLQVQINKQ